jgi:hypothetical protein
MLEGLALRTTVLAGVLVLIYCWWRHPQTPEVCLLILYRLSKSYVNFWCKAFHYSCAVTWFHIPLYSLILTAVLHVIVTCCLQIWRWEMQSFADFHLSRTYSVMTVTCATIAFLIFVRPVALKTDISIAWAWKSMCELWISRIGSSNLYKMCPLVYGLVIFKLQAEFLFEQNLCTPSFLNS